MTLEKIGQHQVQETLLLPLRGKALDYRTAAPVLGDRWSDEVLSRIGPLRFKMRLGSLDRYIPVLRAHRMDEWAREFLSRHTDAVVLHLGCGLDSRAFRLDLPERVQWFDVDFPEVIELRRSFYPDRPRYRLVAGSVTEPAWLDDVPVGRPVLVIAEGLLMYLSEADVAQLLGRLIDRFGGGELIFDVMTEANAKIAGWFGYTVWGIGDPRELERTHPLTLLEAVPALADHRLIRSTGWRLYNAVQYRNPLYRNGIRSLRYRFGG
ncbi:class I SAM-dependent methyltransferase [Nocardia ninae]|uniref:Polyketide synthesis methyltransferase n=1 Tax=Nocardia ninae NBRC 108245 TaxID=1210091 RepID=A0A511MIN7_9NOCA|nr:class I SAM-dependent methyltransferase [Nocardia ninae]GEM39786.1 polyketide synthesis methyltransferase [Nocardia ninae NBRC 108245]